MAEKFSLSIRRDGKREHKLSGTAKEIADSFDTWVHKELGGRKIRFKK